MHEGVHKRPGLSIHCAENTRPSEDSTSQTNTVSSLPFFLSMLASRREKGAKADSLAAAHPTWGMEEESSLNEEQNANRIACYNSMTEFRLEFAP